MDASVKKATIEAYNKIADEFNIRNAISFYQKEAEVFKQLFREEKKILEIGCGTGRDAEMLVPMGFDYIGIDASERMLEKAREKLPNEKFIPMNFFHLTFPSGVFDGFWAAASFLHVPKKDIDIVLQEAKRILKPGGVGYISLKQKKNLDEKIIHQDAFGGIDRFFAFYDQQEFEDILKRNGFEIVSVMTEIENDSDKTVWLCFFVRK